MKRITQILMVIILLVTLTSCKGNSYRELFVIGMKKILLPQKKKLLEFGEK